MGLAKHNPGGQWRLGLSATAASAVLYSAIVVFGVGSASPSAPGAGRDPHASAVLIQPHADTVSGSAEAAAGFAGAETASLARTSGSKTHRRRARTDVVQPDVVSTVHRREPDAGVTSRN